MKRELSEIEIIFWNTYLKWKAGNVAVCNILGYDSIMELVPQFEFQAQGKTYFLDFAELSTRIAIELDGFHFHYKNQKQVVHDKRRERKIILENFTILRYPGTRGF